MNKKTVRRLDQLLDDGLVDAAELAQLGKVIDTFKVAIPEAIYSLIDRNDKNDPIRKQFIPTTEELTTTQYESADPIGDDVHQVIKGVIHRYPDRCLFLPVQVCPVYCRFCFRRENVGSAGNTLTQSERSSAYAYIEMHPEIWEVIITGGDPLILKPALLASIVQQLNLIPHVEVIRIHSRVPVVEPHRINHEMIEALSSKKPVYIAVHANHVKEFTPLAFQALASLVTAGVSLVSQTTLLKGINDNIDALSELMRTFVKHRVKPYYLHHPDLAKGTSHFRVTISEGQALMRQLRGRFSGLCQPTYVIDIPGGHGKVPIGPHYISVSDDQCGCLLTDYQGKLHHYTASDSENA